MRVVSLLPSATELLYAIGHEPVGVSHACDHPPAARDLPTVTRSRIDTNGASADIDRAVRSAAREDGVFEIDGELLASLKPDLVITQGICEVCAVDTVGVREVVADRGLDCDVMTTDPHRLADVLDDIERIGEAVGRSGRAALVRSNLQDRIDRTTDRVHSAAHRPRVVVLDWLAPVMVAGHWVPEVVQRAGGRYGLGEPGTASQPHEWADICAYDPEVLIASPCGFDLEQTHAHRSELTDRPGWDDLSAVHTDDVYAIDGQHYVNRPGPRLVDTLEFIACLLHPDRTGTAPSAAVRPLEAAAPSG